MGMDTEPDMNEKDVPQQEMAFEGDTAQPMPEVSAEESTKMMGTLMHIQQLSTTQARIITVPTLAKLTKVNSSKSCWTASNLLHRMSMEWPRTT